MLEETSFNGGLPKTIIQLLQSSSVIFNHNLFVRESIWTLDDLEDIIAPSM